jgi:hypothetical protein
LTLAPFFHLGTVHVDGMLRCWRDPPFLRKVSILERNTGKHIVWGSLKNGEGDEKWFLYPQF